MITRDPRLTCVSACCDVDNDLSLLRHSCNLNGGLENSVASVSDSSHADINIPIAFVQLSANVVQSVDEESVMRRVARKDRCSELRDGNYSGDWLPRHHSFQPFALGPPNGVVLFAYYYVTRQSKDECL